MGFLYGKDQSSKLCLSPYVALSGDLVRRSSSIWEDGFFLLKLLKLQSAHEDHLFVRFSSADQMKFISLKTVTENGIVISELKIFSV